MAILAFPDITPNQATYGLMSQGQTFQSDLTGTTQTAALPTDLWSAQLTFANVTGANAGILRAFLSSLRGQTGRFYLPMFDHPTPSGTALGAGRVSGANQAGDTLITDGWDISQPELLAPGDYFQVGDELHMITATASSNTGGVSALTFSPPLRTSPADNALIVTVNPCFVAMLTDGRQARWSEQPGQIYALTISAIEAIAP